MEVDPTTTNVTTKIQDGDSHRVMCFGELGCVPVCHDPMACVLRTLMMFI